MMNLELTKLPQYMLLREEDLTDIHSKGYLLRHKKSGARVMLIANEDDNKVFNIAFRTTPSDSTGVAHITEHSVLCGSRAFPSKDPFVELVKGSMNTFLNAMTYPDKTMYPVASCNDKDFANLMHVYLDAVFYPNTYQKEEIFRQEGWSYQIESPEEDLTINGVVYNEMKGAYSSPDDVLERVILNSLYPDTTYGNESGGDPQHIPELTYEAFLNFHRTYYHPSNSYIYLYGDMDFTERLSWLDEAYLSRFDARPVTSEIVLQAPFEAMKMVEQAYPLTEEDDPKDNTYLAFSASVGQSTDTRVTGAFSILEYALLDMPGAPVKQALLDAGIGSDIQSSFDDGVRQPVFSIIAKYANPEDQERFLCVVRKTLEQIVTDGVDPMAIEAAINSMEFRFREADYGQFPKGLMYGIDVFDSWLYDEDKPFDCLKQLQDYVWLKTQIGTGYFEGLIRTWLLDNPHTSLVVLTPSPGLTTKMEEDTARALADYKASLSQTQIRELIAKTKALRAFQETPSTQEELEKIPMLSRADLKREIRPLKTQQRILGGVSVLHHAYETNGIAYLQILLDASKVPQQDLPYLGVLRSILGQVGTAKHTYTELANEINIHTGGIIPGVSVFPHVTDNQKLYLALGVQIRTLFDQVEFSFDIVREILKTSDFTDQKRIKELVQSMRSRLEARLSSAGSGTAATRCMAGFSAMYYLNDAIGGISFYRLVQELVDDFEGHWTALQQKLSALMTLLVRPDGLLVSYTGTEEGIPVVEEGISSLAAALRQDNTHTAHNGDRTGSDCSKQTVLKPYPPITFSVQNEGFTGPGKVQYVARCGNFRDAGYEYTGALRVLRTIMSYEYLWNNIRVVGGAYGCSGNAARNGDTSFVSYRDPHLKRTNEVYEGIPSYLERFTVDARDMDKYIIGTVSDMDTPLNPSALGSRSLHAFLGGVTEDQLQKERDEVLETDQEQIRAIAPLMRAVLSQNHLCAVGNEEKIREAGGMFDHVEEL